MTSSPAAINSSNMTPDQDFVIGTLPEARLPADPVRAIRDAMINAGITPPDYLEPDGELHRFHIGGDRHGQKNGFYVFHLDGVAAGYFGCWKRGISQNWCAKERLEMTPTERKAHTQRAAEMKRKRDTATAERHAEARTECQAAWDKAEEATGSAYLTRKEVKPYGLRQATECLLVPMRDISGNLWSLQRIYPNGVKKFWTGGKMQGCFHLIGKPRNRLFICEGYATGASIHDATGEAVAVAFNTGNLKPVAEALQKKYPQLQMVVAADNDHATDGNPGITKGTEAAEAVGSLLAVPDLSGDEGTDFNDLSALRGLKAVQEALEAATVVRGAKKGRFDLANHFEGYDQEINYLVKGWLPAESFGVVYGASGTFKSFFVLNWALHIALGRQWNNCKVVQGAVLYIAGEGGLGVRQRIKALADEYNNGKGIPDLYRLDHPVYLDGDESELQGLLAAINQKRCEAGKDFGLIIFDTTARCMTGDENSNTDMGRLIRACDGLKARTGATVLLVHHTGKGDSKTARGASALRAACDYEYLIERAQTPDLQVVAKCKKMKDGKDDHAAQFTLKERHLFNDSDGDPVISLVCSDSGKPVMASAVADADGPSLTQRQQSIWQAVRSRQQHGDSTARAVVRDDIKAQGAYTKNYSRDLQSLIVKGMLKEREGSLYAVLPDGEPNEDP
ncbi:AAA family ATPase [Microbulbifer elongatus]|uniref:AAA family ATPase n=1 Tax=Microbulbifer elongatus TaxID=86173 RepID=UPI001CFF00A2|nr:AAA family ATPase [Microbulbifer elongatus]